MILSENTELLTKGSHFLIKVSCDICSKAKEMEYRTYHKLTNGLIEKYYCHKCSRIKTNQTNKKKYGGIAPLCDKNVLQKMINTNIERYGIDFPSKLDEIKNKQEDTNKQKYGFKSALQNPTIIIKSKKTMIDKYGVEYPIQNEEIKTRISKTNVEKYAEINPFNSEVIRQKIHETNTLKYGFDNPMKSKLIIDKANLTKQIKWFEKHKNNNVINYNITSKEITFLCDKGHENIINYTTYKNRTILNTTICTECNPINSYSTSGYEIQLQNFIKENYDGVIEFNVRDILKKNEIDIYLPELKIGFEFNGLFWHCEYNLRNNYHLDKTEECESKDIQLIHIYEDAWLYKQDIVKSRILNLLGKSQKIFARKCEIKELSDNEILRDFLNQNHLQGFIGSKHRIGLFYDNKLISLMIFGLYRTALGQKSKNDCYEMLRFCNKLNISVVGGASRLFNYFVKKYKPIEIISYADRSWSHGNLYYKLGFKFCHKTSPNYYYILDGIRKHRFGFSKSKLVKNGADIKKTEHEIMLEKRIFRIYDSGNLKFQYILIE